VREHQPDAVLTDIRMPPTHTTEGIDAAKRIRVDHPSIGVVVLSQYVEEDYALALLSDGVAGLGYLLKERVSDIDELVRALNDVANGGSALDPKVVEGLMMRKSADAGSPLLGLTDKERSVLEVRREAHQRGLLEARAGRGGGDQPTCEGGSHLRRGDPLKRHVARRLGAVRLTATVSAVNPIHRGLRMRAH
jgi:response regulator RpfG family c-di-GMP phosphodiesterase